MRYQVVRRSLIVGALLLTTFIQPASALVVCAKRDSNTGLAKEKSKLFLKIACTPGKEVSVGIRVNGLPGSNGEVVFDGVNVQVVDGSGATTGPTTGLGNLIVGYNEDFGPIATRTGSHNLVVGTDHSYTASGGLVAGFSNEISGDFATVSGGQANEASGPYSSVSGGVDNVASNFHASVSGGGMNTANAFQSSVTGGSNNTASGNNASVTGGRFNVASGTVASVNGGVSNTASTFDATVSGGGGNTAAGFQTTVGGGVNLNVTTNYVWHAVQDSGFPTGSQY